MCIITIFIELSLETLCPRIALFCLKDFEIDYLQQVELDCKFLWFDVKRFLKIASKFKFAP